MPGFNHTTENMKTKTLLGFFLLSVMAFCVSACQDDAEIILFSGSELVDETGTCTNTVSSTVLYLNGSVVILGGLSLVNSLHAYTFASLKRKKLISTTPLNDALNALILALNASAAAFVLLFTKKFRILS